MNTEEQQELAAHFNIRSIPTLMIFRDNIIVFAEAGALPASALDQVLAVGQALDMDAVRRESRRRKRRSAARQCRIDRRGAPFDRRASVAMY